jgi:adenylate cyclase
MLASILIIASVVLFDFGYELPLLQALIVLITSFIVATAARYAHSRIENAFIKSMFSRYVNKDVLQALLKSKTYLKEGEKRELSVLFSDLRGFTDFSETLPPEELTRLLNEYFALMVSEIFKQNGTVDKFIGDAVMAFWNAPLSLKHHELHAVTAAIGMQNALVAFNSTQNTSLKMGIGVHAGEAVVGNIGGEERTSYTALGDSVNTASRIEGISKKYGARIVVSQTVAAAVTGKLNEGWYLRKLDEVKLKGKQKSVLIYEVTDISPLVIGAYEEAFSLYQKGRLKESLAILQSDILTGDVPASVLSSRIQTGLIQEGFDGIWVFDEK